MRDYKFRGQSIDSGEWVYGFVLANYERCFIAYYGGDRQQTLPEITEVDPATVGQYLCIDDSNGKGIHEGDRVRWWAGEYCQGYWQYGGVLCIEYAFDYDAVGTLANSDGREIIGNIHEAAK